MIQIEIKDAMQVDLDYVKANALHEIFKFQPATLSGWSKSLFIDDDCIAVGGVIKINEGVGEAWMILSQKAAEHKIEIVRTARKIIERAFEELSLWRIQAIERVGFDESLKFVNHIGFKTEGVMLKYMPDKTDVYMTSIIKGE